MTHLKMRISRKNILLLPGEQLSDPLEAQKIMGRGVGLHVLLVRVCVRECLRILRVFLLPLICHVLVTVVS